MTISTGQTGPVRKLKASLSLQPSPWLIVIHTTDTVYLSLWRTTRRRPVHWQVVQCQVARLHKQITPSVTQFNWLTSTPGLMDHLAFASLAQIKILLVPVGSVTKSLFDKRAAEIRSFDNIPLGDITVGDKDQRGA